MEGFALKDGQIYENDFYVIKIEQLDESFRAMIFAKTDDGLRFVQIFYNKTKLIIDLLKKMNMIVTDKILILRERA